MEILRFQVAGERYGIPTARVREVIASVAVTRLVDTPEVIAGAIDVRGEVMPVVDLRVRFGAAPAPIRTDEQWMVVASGSRSVVLRADAVPGLAQVDDQDLTAARALTAAATPGVGLARLPDGLTLIYDPEAFLDDTEERALERALRSQAESG